MQPELDPHPLRSKGFRLTPQRLAILNVLQEADCHLSPVEIFQRAEERLPGLTEATVYRTLDFLADQGLALVAHLGSGHLVYETARHEHHHLVCRTCGQTAQIDHAVLETLYAQFQSSTGFEIDTSHVVFFGHCPACLKEMKSKVESGRS